MTKQDRAQNKTAEAPSEATAETQSDGFVVGQRAPGARTRPAARAADSQQRAGAQPAGAPEGYEPDTSVQYVQTREGEPDQIEAEDGTTSDVSPANQNPVPTLEELPKDHTYRDRVEAQARSLGIPVEEGQTLEYLLWKIQMSASS